MPSRPRSRFSKSSISARTLNRSCWTALFIVRRKIVTRCTSGAPPVKVADLFRRTGYTVSAPRSLRRRREVALLIVALAAAALVLIAYGTHLMRSLELHSVDARFAVRGTQAQPRDIVVVKVDDRTFSQLGRAVALPALAARPGDRPAARGRREDDRRRHPVHRADRATPGQRPDRSDRRAGGVVLSTTEVDAHGESRIFGGESVVRRNRRPGRQHRDSSPTRAARSARCTTSSTACAASPSSPPKRRRANRSTQPRWNDGSAWIDFRGPPGTFRQLSYSSVLRGKVPDSAFRGKTVDRRRLGALAAGRPPDLDHRRRTDGRAGNPGQRDLDRRARLPARLLAPAARPAADPPDGRRPGRRDAALLARPRRC